MEAENGIMILREKDIIDLVSNRFIYINWNKIRSHSHRFETFEHLMAKAAISKLVLKKKDGLLTEYQYPDCKVIDVLQIKKKELIGYEIIYGNKLKPSTEKFRNTSIITVDLNRASEDVKQAFRTLENYFKKFVV